MNWGAGYNEPKINYSTFTLQTPYPMYFYLLHEQEYHLFTYSYNNMQVPFSMKPTQYGEIFSKVEIDGITKTVAYANGLTYFIESS